MDPYGRLLKLILSEIFLCYLICALQADPSGHISDDYGAVTGVVSLKVNIDGS